MKLLWRPVLHRCQNHVSGKAIRHSACQHLSVLCPLALQSDCHREEQRLEIRIISVQLILEMPIWHITAYKFI